MQNISTITSWASSVPTTGNAIVDGAIAGLISSALLTVAALIFPWGGEDGDSSNNSISDVEDSTVVTDSEHTEVHEHYHGHQSDGDSESSDDSGGSDTESVESEYELPTIDHTPQHLENSGEDDLARSQGSVRTFQQEGEMRLIVTWPTDRPREWVELDAGNDVDFVFASRPSDVEFNTPQFRLNDHVRIKGFIVKIHFQGEIVSRDINIKFVESGEVFHNITLERAS